MGRTAKDDLRARARETALKLQFKYALSNEANRAIESAILRGMVEALVKRLGLNIDRHNDDDKWFVYLMEDREAGDAYDKDINRAICLCVARMKGATEGGE